MGNEKVSISGTFQGEDAELIREFKARCTKSGERYPDGLLRIIKKDLNTK